MKTIRMVFDFFLHPDTNQTEGGFKKKSLELFRLLLINFIIVLLLTIPVGILRLYFNLHPIGLDIPIYIFLLINGLVIPVIEESAFRLSLIYSKINLSISFLFIFFFISSYILSGAIFATDKLLLRVFVSIGASSILYLVLSLSSINRIVATFWKKNFRTVFYFFLTLFVLRHLDEFVFSFQELAVVLIILSPKFVSGIFLSYSRIRLGFSYGIFLHILINAVAMGIILITS